MISPLGENTVAIVIPWFGREQKGGAEQQAWNLAVRLSGRGYTVEVLTTCCRSFQEDWAVNHHPVGLTSEPEGFSIRRFPVEPRNRAEFDRVCGHLLSLAPSSLKPGVSPISDEDERIFREHLIRCPALLGYLRDEGWRYSAFVFLPYLYGPILDGLPLVASRALLQPCLHDEAYAYLRCVQRIMFAAHKILWLSEGEYELGRKLFGPAMITKSVVGMAGVEEVLSPAAKPGDLALPARYVLLLGRKDTGKGTMHAIEAFKIFQRQSRSDLHLLLAGPGDVTLADAGANILDLGLVSEAMRCWLLRHALALAQPSPNESFSRVIFEAWQCDRPVIVRRSCRATAAAVRASTGGWDAETLEEWSERYAAIDQMAEEDLLAVGRRGAAFAQVTADWSRVMARYDAVLRPMVQQRKISLAVRLRLTSIVPRRIRLLASAREVGAWNLQPGEVCQTDWIESTVEGPAPALHLVSDVPAGHCPPDPRLLGTFLQNLEVRGTDPNGAKLSGQIVSSPPATTNGEATKSGPTLAPFGTDPTAWIPRFTQGWNRGEGPNGSAGPRWTTGDAEIVFQPRNSQHRARAIHQVLPNLGYGDAIGNHAIWIRDQLQALGYDSEIYARHIAPAMLHQAYAYTDPASIPAEAAVIYHHSIGTEITPWVCQHPGPKALIYHNITPAVFFEPYRPDYAEILRQGRAELPTLSLHFPISVGDSQFNADELAACGFPSPGVLPLCIDTAHWASPPDEPLMERLQDGRTNILFVGRVVPNKRFEDLIYTFKFWLEEDPEARLFLVGSADVVPFYLESLQELARRLRVDHAVHFVGQVDDRQLHAYYRCASMFWCFSEHEGFCVPVIEACAFGVPVIARAEGAVPDTLGDAGQLIYTRPHPVEIARWIATVRSVERAKMQARLDRYGAINVIRQLENLVERLCNTSPAKEASAASMLFA